MQTKYAYWSFKNVISEQDRNKIQCIASKAGYKKASIKNTNHVDVQPEKGLRDASVSFSGDPYLYEVFSPFIHSANESAGWKYDIDWFEDVQIARYKKNQHQTWHNDGPGDHFGVYGDGDFKDKVRKLSLVSFISNSFDGGELEFIPPGYEDEVLRPVLEVGDVVVFPSFIPHRSTPIIKGIKYSVAMWCLGPPFK